MPRSLAWATTPASGIFFGWKVVAAAFVVATFTWGIGFYGPPVFLNTIQRTTGWPITLISAAFTCNMLCGAVVMANLAALHDRFGVARVTQAGALLTAIGLLGWAFAVHPWQLFAATPVSGAGWALTSGAALNAIVSPWFDRNRPAALSMAYNGTSAAGIVFSPLWVALIGNLGFPAAAAIIGAAALATVWWLAARYIAPTPASLGLHPDGGAPTVARPVVHHAAEPIGPNGAWRDRRLITQAAACALLLFAQIGVFMQLFSLLVPALGAAAAGTVMGLLTVFALTGRGIAAALMRPDTNRRMVGIANCGVQIMGSIALFIAAGQDEWLLIAGSLLFGLGVANATSLPPLIAQAEFTPRDAPHAVSLIFGISQGCFAFSPLAFGFLRGLDGNAGDAPLVFAAAALLQAGSATALMLGMPPRAKTRAILNHIRMGSPEPGYDTPPRSQPHNTTDGDAHERPMAIPATRLPDRRLSPGSTQRS